MPNANMAKHPAASRASQRGVDKFFKN